MAQFYMPDPDRFPSAGHDIPPNVIETLVAYLPEDASVLVGAHLSDGGMTVEADLVIITSYAIHVVEVKNYKLPLIITANGPWQKINGDGTVSKLSGNDLGSGQIMPDAQADRAADQVARVYQRYISPSDPRGSGLWPRVSPYVLIPSPHPKCEIDVAHGQRSRLLVGTDQLIPNLRQRDGESRNHPERHPDLAVAQRMIERQGLQPIYELQGVNLAARPTHDWSEPYKRAGTGGQARDPETPSELRKEIKITPVDPLSQPGSPPWYRSTVFLTSMFFLAPPVWAILILTDRKQSCVPRLFAAVVVLGTLVCVVFLYWALQMAQQSDALPILRRDSPAPMPTATMNEKAVQFSPTPRPTAGCVIEWNEHEGVTLEGKNRYMVWEAIVKQQVAGSGMTARKFYDLVVSQNPSLKKDGYVFKAGKTYLLPKCN